MIGLILGLGSNIGNREKNILTAINLLKEHFNYLDHSSLFSSIPVDYLEQSDFLNMAIEFQKPNFSPQTILNITQQIEKEMGRKKTIDKGPRNIDIDILFLGKSLLDQNNLKIPHPEIKKRNFVLFPLAELQSFIELKKRFKLDLDTLSSKGLLIYKDRKEITC